MMAWGLATLSKSSSIARRARDCGAVTEGGLARLIAGASRATTIPAALRFNGAISAETPGCSEEFRLEIQATAAAAAIHSAISPADARTPLQATAGATCQAGHSVVSHCRRRDDPSRSCTTNIP